MILEQDQASGEQLSPNSPASGEQTRQEGGGRKDSVLSLLLHRGTCGCTPSNFAPSLHPGCSQTPQPIGPSSPKGKGSQGEARRLGSS